MFGVRKSNERKFWKGLVNALKRVIGRVKTQKDVNGLARWLGFFQFSKAEETLIDRIIRAMVNTNRRETASSWREAAQKAGKGPEIAQAIANEMKGPVGMRVEEIVSENAKYIKTLPQQWAKYVVHYVQKETEKGKRPETIEEELRKVLPEQITGNLKTIARTESAKANAALVEARAENLGIRAYIWRSAKDERTRHSHGRMDGVLVFFNDPPNPEALYPGKGQRPYGSYHAGNTFNCRCYMEPVVDINFLPDSIRVHANGRVSVMTRKQIQQRFGKIS